MKNQLSNSQSGRAGSRSNVSGPGATDTRIADPQLNSTTNTLLKLGIDASNLSVRGGGATHLRGMLEAAVPQDHRFGRVAVFAGRALLDSLPKRDWLQLQHHPWLDRGLLWRTAWQILRLTTALEKNSCDLLFTPCGNYLGTFRPFVAMSHNLLLFEPRERQRFGWSCMRLKLEILSFVQQRCFQNADGLVLISNYAKRCIRRSLHRDLKSVPVIYHGVGERFVNPPRAQKEISAYSESNPFRFLYVSTVSNYKHQDKLLRAFAKLCVAGFPVRLDLVGGAYRPALRRLEIELAKHPELVDRVTYHGSIPIERIHEFYQQADGFVFASSCENMPNILVEAMQSGLPICCSSCGPMPEILGDRGIYFSPDSEPGMCEAMMLLLTSATDRTVMAAESFKAAKAFTWESCADQTFEYFKQVSSRPSQSAQVQIKKYKARAA